jgi:hypothetical protein
MLPGIMIVVNLSYLEKKNNEYKIIVKNELEQTVK